MPEEANAPSSDEQGSATSTPGTAAKPEGAARKPDNAAGKPETTAYGGYKFAADIWASLVTLLVGLAWPATLLLLIYLVWHDVNAAAFDKFVSDFMQDKQTVKASAGLTQFSVEITSLVKTGVTQQIAKNSGKVTNEQSEVAQRSAASATAGLVQQGSQPPETRMKILWVDDHPQNNIGLQFAFQSLGMVVVCIDSNDAIGSSFTIAGQFDVVITDMFRDPTGNTEVGWQTVNIIKTDHPKVPVIIYAGSYSAAHKDDTLSDPVLANTNNTQYVFDLVRDIAVKKLK